MNCDVPMTSLANPTSRTALSRRVPARRGQPTPGRGGTRNGLSNSTPGALIPGPTA
jgi:hypothetical protein